MSALTVIARQGFDRTTVRDIAIEAGASVGSVHYYFKNKEELLFAAFEESERRTVARLDAIDAAGGTAVDRLARVIDMCFPLDSVGDPQWEIEIDVWQQAARHRVFRELFARGNRTWVGRLQGILAEGVAAGEFAEMDVEKEALDMAALIDGLGIYTRVTHHLDLNVARALLERRINSLRRKSGRTPRRARAASST